MTLRLAVFDLDGTVLNTALDLRAAASRALSKNGLPGKLSLEVTKLCFGWAVKSDMEKIIAAAKGVPADELEFVGTPRPASEWGVTEEETLAVQKDFTAFYSLHQRDHTAPYDGIRPLLETLRAGRIHTAVASNKDDRHVKNLTAVIFPGLFEFAAGKTEHIPKKPAPDLLRLIMDRFGATPSETVYVGDTEVDILTGKNAGVRTICVAWGFRSTEFLKQHGAEIIVSTPAELIREMMK